MKDIVDYLLDNNKIISVMESCTGGLMSSTITNISKASLIFKFGAVTYSNDDKIKFGVSQKTIDEYGVYSIEVAKEMSLAIVNYTDSDYGIGITGKLMKEDINNESGLNNVVYYAIYDKSKKEFIVDKVIVDSNDRLTNKQEVINNIVDKIKKNLICE